MGNRQTVTLPPSAPKQFVTQAHTDWTTQMERLFSTQPTVTKTVILPPGVSLNDERLRDGVVVAQRTYTLDTGAYPEWPNDMAFECDLDAELLPPIPGNQNVKTHYAIYPDTFFPDLNCAYCNADKSYSN